MFEKATVYLNCNILLLQYNVRYYGIIVLNCIALGVYWINKSYFHNISMADSKISNKANQISSLTYLFNNCNN
jgi:hypothetical protein